MFLPGALLRDGPPPHVAPAWIHWSLGPNTPDGASVEGGDVPDLVEEEEEEDDRWVPFLQPRRKRARAQSEPNDDDDNRGGDDDNSDGSDGSGSETPDEPDVFPYPVGTKVDRDYGKDGLFWGVIEKHYDDDHSVCVVKLH